MKVNKWTLGLAAVGLVSLPSISQAEEKASTMMTALSSTTISGYVNTSAQWNPGTGNAFVPGFAFNQGKQDGFNLDVVKVSIERPLDEAQWAAGYKVDLIFGPDANALATASTPLGSPNSDFGVKQAYVTLRAPVGNGLDFKLGVWDTIIGYETFDAGSNPNYTRSYGYTIEPTTHTGLLSTYQITPNIGLSAGIANTFGPSINQRANPPKAESYKAYMGALSITLPDNVGFLKGSTLYACVINGLNSASPAAGTNSANRVQTSFYVGGTLSTPITALKVGASYDYAMVRSSGGVGGGHVQAADLYTSFQATEKLSLHARGEYFWQNSEGVVAPVSSSSSQFLSFPGKVLAVTGTVQYDLWKNVLSRLEVRWDHAADGADAYGGDLGSPTAAPGKRNAVLIAANVIYKF